jgi:hypothetical protein
MGFSSKKKILSFYKNLEGDLRTWGYGNGF